MGSSKCEGKPKMAKNARSSTTEVKLKRETLVSIKRFFKERPSVSTSASEEAPVDSPILSPAFTTQSLLQPVTFSKIY
jgi:hypothetical protein